MQTVSKLEGRGVQLQLRGPSRALAPLCSLTVLSHDIIGITSTTVYSPSVETLIGCRKVSGG